MTSVSRVVGVLMVLAALGSSVPAQEVRGRGTAGVIPLWLDEHRIGDSVISQGPDGSVNINGSSFTGLYSGTNDAADGSTGVLGNQTAASGVTFGVQGFSASPNGFGVQGANNVTTSANFAGGVAGYFNGTSGFGIGVYGQTNSPGGTGGFFQTTAESGSALTANATSTTGNVSAIYAQTSCVSCGVISAQELATTGEGPSIYGGNASIDGVGVEGRSSATTGFGQGFYGETNSPTGIVALLRSQANGGASGSIIIGQVGVGSAAVNVFRVDDTGKGFFDGGTQTGGADFAESVPVAKGTHPYEPGDLLVLDATADRQLKLSGESYSTLVAGIYSTKPGVLATTHKLDTPATDGEVPLAIVGIVPCKVSAENGPIQRGDLLVTSSTPGYAMKGTDRSRMLGAVVGKAMEPLTSGTGTIQVLVTLQ